MHNIISFSGGRTSAYLVYLAKQMQINEGIDFTYIFMDTGMEHPKTYTFIKTLVKEWDIPLVCLRTKFNPTLGQANSYTIVDVNKLEYDPTHFREMFKKYSTPTINSPFCTDRLKVVPHDKYCNDHFGKKNYISWLGIRIDEPKRLQNKKPKFKYLADISEFEKQDILDWWSNQPFDLDLDEYLGNCVFCIKKGTNKLALASKDEPEKAINFIKLVEESTIRIMPNRNDAPHVMFRGRHSLGSIIEAYKDVPKHILYNRLQSTKRLNDGPCSESCEIT